MCLCVSDAAIVCMCFVKVALGSGTNRLMFELSDLLRFIAMKAGVSELDLGFVHTYSHTCCR